MKRKAWLGQFQPRQSLGALTLRVPPSPRAASCLALDSGHLDSGAFYDGNLKVEGAGPDTQWRFRLAPTNRNHVDATPCGTCHVDSCGYEPVRTCSHPAMVLALPSSQAIHVRLPSTTIQFVGIIEALKRAVTIVNPLQSPCKVHCRVTVVTDLK